MPSAKLHPHPHPARRRAWGLTLLIAAALLFTGGPLPAVAAPQAGPTDLTVEELRLTQAVPQDILRRSGYGDAGPALDTALRQTQSVAAAEAVVAQHGLQLWKRAVNQARGLTPVVGDLSKEDDRPLYWARLAMSKVLRQWQPVFGLSDASRTALLDKLEISSRGQDSVSWEPLPPDQPWKLNKIVLTGFDPFGLSGDIRASNPSGAAALALDGELVLSDNGRFFRIETIMLPVRWKDFTEGTVERALSEPIARADMFFTVSQGRPGRFDLENYNGAWRGGALDNENASSTGLIPVSDPATQPQWTASTHSHPFIVSVNSGRFPVYNNTQVTEIPVLSPPGTAPVVRPNGPSSVWSTARAGSGGDFLSNEVAYRATLLRDRMGRSGMPGGHVHTPVLEFGSGAVTDAQLVRNRQDILAQLHRIIRVAGAAPLP
ncbi:pyroglutamyl peptidase [Streptomyces paludis]|uniref:Pyroglutamyl peptidase n=1 Tax=Streptomyces paludis TaxID=2282738 RepID=A0A345HPP4_9ACTN|nr:pyroglutamyl peptidase [Streptomyces paludis]AXG78668.1 pyroglutamyl peptidase [Streptomyces paludis]